MNNMITFKNTSNWGVSFESDCGAKLIPAHNFRAIVEGRPVIAILGKDHIRDHGSSYDITNITFYDEVTLEKIDRVTEINIDVD